MAKLPDPIDRAIAMLPLGRRVTVGSREVEVAVLIREQDWRPLDAPWWRGKQVSVIGADINGNFFLRHPDGSVRYWDHASGSDVVIARSVRAFAASIH